MGQDARVKIKSLGWESGGLSSSVDSAFHQVRDLGQASNLPGPQVTICNIRGMGLEQWFSAFNAQQNCLWSFLRNIQPETSSEMFQKLLRWIFCLRKVRNFSAYVFFRFPFRSDILSGEFIYQCVLPRATPVAFGQVPLSVASDCVKWEDLTMMWWVQQLLMAVVLGAWLGLTVNHNNNEQQFAFPNASHFTEKRNNWK